MSELEIFGLLMGVFAAGYLTGLVVTIRRHMRFERDLVDHNQNLLNELYRAVTEVARLSKLKRGEGGEWKDG